MKLFSKLGFIVSGMLVMAALVAGTAVTFAQEDAPADDGNAQVSQRGPKEAKEEVADVFGISVDELQAYYDAGDRHSDIIEDLGLDEDTIRAELREVKQALKMEKKADLLGISVDELQAMLDDGMNFREIAEELGVELPERNGRRGNRGGGDNAGFFGNVGNAITGDDA